MYQPTKDLDLPTSETSIETLLGSIVSHSLKYAYSLAIYRLPQEDTITAVVCLSQQEYTKNQGNGFVVSPFLDTDKKKQFIKSDIEIHFQNNEVKYSSVEDEKAKKFLDEVRQNQIEYSNDALPQSDKLTSVDYVSITKEAIKKIQEGNLKKVVTARRKSIEIHTSINPATHFLSLVESQNSFVSLVYLPGNGIWLGASPELLVSTNREHIFHTVSLAGTQKAVSEDVTKAVWSHKEIEEQALVSRYIINCFKSIRLREYDEDGPKTVKSGNLFHLKTDFKVNLTEVPFPDLGTQMLELLHPTSAVCGMPKAEALAFINEHEKLDRKFYSGYLGPVNMNEETHIFVNIRCAELLRDKAMLYSGAGITAESIPEKEYLETELKMQLMENLLSIK